MMTEAPPPPCLARGDCECAVSLSDLADQLGHSLPYTGDLWVEQDGIAGLSSPVERINDGDMLENSVLLRLACGECNCSNGVLQCSRSNCSDDCQWSQWQPWASCSRSCGGGERRRNRTIASPARFGGAQCRPADFQEVEQCNTNSCPCTWSQWSPWSQCSRSCGGGQKSRSRTPSGDCTEDVAAMETAACSVQPCGSTTTSAPGVCTNGKVLRQCSNVSCPHTCAQQSGEACSEAQACTEGCFCPQGKVFDEMAQNCVLPADCECNITSVACGRCSQAVCKNGVATCEQTQVCNCEWAPWEDWSPCSKACGRGNRRRRRHEATQSRGGGQACSGPATESEQCNNNSCPGCLDRDNNVVPPGGTMQSDSACEICYCDYYTQSRLCQPKPSDDPTRPAPQWSPWSQFSACSSACGTGNRHRTRACLRSCANDTSSCVIDPQTGLADRDTQPCNEQDCQPPVDCQVSEWRNGTCVADCDGENPTAVGQRMYVRDVVRQPSNGGSACPQLQLTMPCTKTCRVDCVAGEWSQWSECAKSCGSESACNPSCGVGHRERQRPIERPASNGGRSCHDKEYNPCRMPCNETVCSGPETEISCATKCWRTCDDVRANKKCPASTECSPGCGCPSDMVRQGGACVQVSQCNCTHPDNPSLAMPPGSTVDKDCNKCTCTNGQFVCETKSCVQNCEWSEWQKDGGCSVTCGSGKQNWTRSVTKTAKNGGIECIGGATRETDCFGSNGQCCNPNDAYVDTGRCEPTCQQLRRPDLQQPGSNCRPGCQCQTGKVRDASGNCISIDDCLSCVVGGVAWPNGKEEVDRGNCSKRYCANGRLLTAPLTPDEVPACTQSDEILASLAGAVKTLDSGGCCYRASLSACSKTSTLLRAARRTDGSVCKFVTPINADRCAGACPASNGVTIDEEGIVKLEGECSCCRPTAYSALPPTDVACVSGGTVSLSLFSIDSCQCDGKLSKPGDVQEGAAPRLKDMKGPYE